MSCWGSGDVILGAGYRWLRTLARGTVGLLTILPAVALTIAVFIDRGLDGEPRPSLFPIALLALDPFAWTCASNSLIFATMVTGLALIGGVGLGWTLSGHHFPGRGALRAGVASMLAASPACLALGFIGISGMPDPSSWPSALKGATAGGSNLETWHGWPAWVLWIWASLPGPLALVTLTTATALERVQRSWRDAARLAGSGGFRTWHGVIWPLIRPAAARAVAIVFPLALVEPGAPLILGLRRTVAFQIVEAASRPDPFPRIAVWAAMAAVIAMAGRGLLRWWGGTPLLDVPDVAPDRMRSRMSAMRAGPARAIAGGLIIAGSVTIAWLPIVGLIRLIAGADAKSGTDSTHWSVTEMVHRALGPPVPQLMVNSLVLGLEVGLAVLILAWLLRPDPGARLAPTFSSRLVGRFALMPPLIQGVGLLTVPFLTTLAAASLTDLPGLTGPLAGLAGLARELSLERNPWAFLTVAVGLSVGSGLLHNARRASERQSDETRSGLDAALLAGASVTGARAVAARWPRRWIGGFLLAAVLAAVNLTPALLFTPWMDGRSVAPALVELVNGRDDSRLQAAALAFCVLAGNLAGLCTARLAPVRPPEWDADPP
jgi:ABC-type Fe3+ transport system permease subunit